MNKLQGYIALTINEPEAHLSKIEFVDTQIFRYYILIENNSIYGYDEINNDKVLLTNKYQYINDIKLEDLDKSISSIWFEILKVGLQHYEEFINLRKKKENIELKAQYITGVFSRNQSYKYELTYVDSFENKRTLVFYSNASDWLDSTNLIYSFDI